MNDHPFLRFIGLVNCDQKLTSLENEKERVDSELAAVKKQEDQVAHDRDEMHKRIVYLKKKS